PVWLHIPGSSPFNGTGAGITAPVAERRENGDNQDPVLLVPPGQLLPYRTQRPLRFRVEQLAADAHETKVRIQFLSGHQRMPLAGRIATFQRGFWEQMAKGIASVLPWTGSARLDRFEVQVHFHV